MVYRQLLFLLSMMSFYYVYGMEKVTTQPTLSNVCNDIKRVILMQLFEACNEIPYCRMIAIEKAASEIKKMRLVCISWREALDDQVFLGNIILYFSNDTADLHYNLAKVFVPRWLNSKVPQGLSRRAWIEQNCPGIMALYNCPSGKCDFSCLKSLLDMVGVNAHEDHPGLDYTPDQLDNYFSHGVRSHHISSHRKCLLFQ